MPRLQPLYLVLAVALAATASAAEDGTAAAPAVTGEAQQLEALTPTEPVAPAATTEAAPAEAAPYAKPEAAPVPDFVPDPAPAPLAPGAALDEQERAEFRRAWGLDALREELRETHRARALAREGQPVAPPQSRWAPWLWNWPGWQLRLGEPFWRSWEFPSYRPHFRHPQTEAAPDPDTPDWRRRARPRYEGPWPWEREEPAPRDDEAAGKERTISL